MALVLADRVQETTTTTGTGTVTLAGAVSGYQTFATIGNGNTTFYTLTSGTNWEVGIGTYASSGTTLARTTILSSSNSNAAIVLAGTSNAFVTYPAERAVQSEGTSGGVPYYSSSTVISSSAALTASAIVLGGGAGAAPATTTTGTGVVTALGVNVGSAGAFVTFNGALGTPSSGTVTNLTGTASININGTVGATTANTVSYTTATGTTSETVPLVIGGTAVSSTLTVQSTSGAGTSDAIIFKTGSQVEQLRILTGGGITSVALVDAVGYKGLPQNSQTASYTLALTDMGKMVNTTTGGVVIPANGTVAFPVGSTVIIYNNSASNQTISITTDTMYLGGTATTGSRTLAQRGLATVVKVASTTWVISGAGVT
jgi:hypothetical protein